MRLWTRDGGRLGGRAILVSLLACLLCGAQQEAAAPAAEPAKPAVPPTPAPAAAVVTQPAAEKTAPAAAVPTEAVVTQPAAEKTAPAATVPGLAGLPQVGIVTANILVVRARPAPHYERIGQFVRGDKVTIVGGNAEWYEVQVPADTRAWIVAQYLNAEGTVTADQVRLHSGPGLVFTTFCTTKQGAKLEVLGPPVDGWQQVRAPADASAWVSRAYVRVPEPEPPAAPEVAVAAPTEAKAETPVAAEPAVVATATTAVAVAPVPVAPPPEAPAVTTVAAPAPAAATPAAPPPAEVAAAPAMPAAETAPKEPTTLPSATETPAPVTVMVPAAPAPDAPIVMKEGVLLSLKSQASELASHVLCMRVGMTVYPICYLKSSRLNLAEWENREVRAYGRELRLSGWSLAVLHVQSIQVNLKP